MDNLTIIEAATDSLREYGFDADVVAEADGLAGQLILERDRVQQRFRIEVKVPLTANTVKRDLGAELVYLTDRVSARSADTLRRLGVRFVDASGNAYLNGGGWYLDVRGRRRQGMSAEYERLGTPINLYTAKRAQVIFALLTWPELLDASVRTLASAAGVSVGIVPSTVNELRRRALWPDRVETRSALIDGWAAAFPETLARSLTIRTVRAEKFDLFFGEVLTSGEAAPSAEMRASSGVVYVDELTTELLMQNRWRTDGTPNLIVRRRFWSRGVDLDFETGETPPLLVYGDLLASDDPRVRSVANEYRSRL